MPQPDRNTEWIIIAQDVNLANRMAAELGLTVSDGYRFVWARSVGTPLVFKRVSAHELAERPVAPARSGW
jgi:hypothetical protein